MHGIASCIALMAMFSLASTSAFGQSGDRTKVKGMINSRTGVTFTVKTAQGSVVTVVLSDSTKVKDNKGLLGARNEKMAQEALIPGLKVDVDGTFDNRGQVVAAGITLDGDDVETSQMIQAGLTPTAKQVASNTERLDALERRLLAVEGTTSGVLTHAPATTTLPTSTPTPASTQASPPAQEATRSPAASPAAEPQPFEAPKTDLNLFRVSLIFALVTACCIGSVALKGTA